MRASVSMAGDGFALLRRRIADIEGGDPHPARPSALPLFSPTGGEDWRPWRRHDERSGDSIPFAIPRLDRMLAGGLRRDALHEVRSMITRDAAAATGFAAALLVRLAASDDRPLMWIVEADAAREGGLPYGIGLGSFGLDPRRLLIVRVHKPRDALWAFEEGLACRGLAGVLAEIRGNPALLDLTASRRLALRAAGGGGMGLLLRQAGEPDASAVRTRWLVEPLPAGTLDDYAAGIGRPAWRLTLERNRGGETGTFAVEWHHDRRIFAPARTDRAARTADSRPRAALSRDRPSPPTDPRALVA